MISYLIFLFALTHLSFAGPFSVNFAGVPPPCYNHKLGGGAWNDGTNGKTADLVESLQAGEFACDDLVSFFWRIQVETSGLPTTPFSAQFELTFLGTTTGQPGIGFAYLNSSLLTYNGTGPIFINKMGLPVQNGNGCIFGQTCSTPDNKCTPQFGAAPKASDGGAKLSGNEAGYILSQTINPPLFQKGSVLSVMLRYDGLDAGEILISRLDVQIKCWPNHTPSGNLQGALANAWYGTSGSDPVTGLLKNPIKTSVGQQTVPLKSGGSSGVVVDCFNVTQTLTGNTFCADIAVSGTGYQNGGVSYGKLYSSWTQGLFITTIGAAPSIRTSYFTYNSGCSTTHQSGQSYSFGPCGCEPVTQYPTSGQPQLFYNSNTAYWCTNDTSVSGQITWNACPGVSFPYGPTSITLKTDAQGTPLRITWNDGTIYTLSNVTFNANQAQCGVPTSQSQNCTSAPVCARPLDIVLLLETSVNTDIIDIQAERDFSTNFVNSFTVSSSNVQFGIYGFSTSAKRYIGLDPNTQNINSAINTVGCTNNNCPGKADILTALKTVVNNEFSGANLRTNSQKVIVLVTRGYDATTYNPQAIADYISTLPVDENGLRELFVIAVPFESIATQPNLYALVTDGDPLNLYQRYDVSDLGTLASARDVAQRVCGLAQKADYCGSCCGFCDSSCSGNPCVGVNNCTASPICGQSYVITPANGATCCSVSYGETCGTQVNASTCQTYSCNPDTKKCEWSGGCPAASNCIVPTCTQTSPGVYGCQPIALPGKPNVGTCDTVSCVAGAWKVNTGAATCTNTSCAQRSCVVQGGLNQCVLTGEPAIDPSPLAQPNFCYQRLCDDASGGFYTTAINCDPRPCHTVTCVNSTGCVYTAVTCNDPANKCDLTTCNTTLNACPTTKTYKQCVSADPCETCGPCVTSTGQCPLCTTDVCCKFPTLPGCLPTPTPEPTPTPGVTPTPTPTPTSSCPVDCVSDVCNARACFEGSTTCQTSPVDCDVIIGSLSNQCARSTACDKTLPAGQQCTVEYINCSTYEHPPCTEVIADPDFVGCCRVVPLRCPGDLCHTGSCNVSTGQCELRFNCETTNPCFPAVCGANGCENPAKCQSGISGCTTQTCNITTGECGTEVTIGCVSEDPCFTSTCVTDPVSGKDSCVIEPFCPKSTDICFPSVCRVNASGHANCVNEPLDCGLGATGCRDAGCNPDLGGCYAVPQNGVCQQDPCHIGTCNVTDGSCIFQELDCSDPANFPPNVTSDTFCYPLVCDPNVPAQPCQVRINNCTQNYTKANGTCDIIRCNNQTNECELTKQDCFPLVALIAGLAGGAIAGIVVAAVIGFLLISGGAGALSTIEITPEETVMSNNPIYKDKGTHGINALHNDCD